MKINMGKTDRIIRAFIALIIAVLYFTGTLTGTIGVILLVLAGIFLITSMVSFCPLYPLFGFSTRQAKTKGH